MSVTRVDELTDEQRARFDEWADRWVAIGLRTGRADRARFEVAMRECYHYAGVDSPGVVVLNGASFSSNCKARNVNNCWRKPSAWKTAAR